MNKSGVREKGGAFIFQEGRGLKINASPFSQYLCRVGVEQDI